MSVSLLQPSRQPSRQQGSRSGLYSAQGSYSNVGRAPSLQSRPTTVPSDMGAGSYWDESTDGGARAPRADVPLEVAIYAKAGMATLTLSALAHGPSARPLLEAGQILCVEPSSDAREYVTVTAVSLRASVIVQVTPALRYDHPEGTAVRKV
jgi:hypothetical protein